MTTTDPTPHDPATLDAWLDQERTGELPAAERAALAAALRADSAARREHRRLAAALEAARVPVRPGFAAEVVEGLPRAAWERSGKVAWALPVAVLAALALAATLLLGRAGSLGASFGTALALFDFLQATALAGAGLLGASWRGLGLGLEHLIADSKLNLAVLGLGVLCLNLLFVRLLAGRRKAAAAVTEDEAGG